MNDVVVNVDLIKKRMNERDLTQVKLAEKINVRKATVNAIVNGKSVPTLLVALKIAEELTVNVEEIWSIKR